MWIVMQDKPPKGNKHRKEVQDGPVTHSMVVHLLEEHKGAWQNIMLRVISKYKTLINFGAEVLYFYCGNVDNKTNDEIAEYKKE